MIDLKILLSDFDNVKTLLLSKKVESQKLSLAYNLITKYKDLIKELENLRSNQNVKSKLFFEHKKQNKDIKELQYELLELKNNITSMESELNEVSNEMNELLLAIPNLPDSKTPKGDSENDNVVIDTILTPKKFDFEPKEHWELAEGNKWIDFDCGVRLAKSRFSILRGGGAKLNRALINFMLDHNSSYGFEEINTPVIANKDSLLCTAQLPKFEEDMFKISSFIDTSTEYKTQEKGYKEKGHELYLISTAEISLTNMYRDTIIPLEDLPIKLCAYTPCFRKEAGSAGKDTRGIIRQHQFDKVELVAITTQDSSDSMQDLMIEVASGILKKLNLPHRLVQLCSGDLGFSASNTIDIEVWLPGQNCYREISSISNIKDFQARRGKIRYKNNKKNILAHTLNGSSLAVGRTLVAIMENYQLSNGDIEIPEILRKYLV
ncbi:serine--tRNA ligase [Helicobacter sp. MIT 14-3879]|uniref:serine--tRNA ligase n=1 Tax=Helicobacter sp. MIT 14-3879 TaxID=2040649 RepID=UPI000E1F0221|nr:serine--tRNA ligase [Helicobacter sp. MIT 14-3879]RDU62872.1 serine--tRNA ligase [Helicobacter sp. MIT 14-3879]